MSRIAVAQDGAYMLYPRESFIPIERMRILAKDCIANEECDVDWWNENVDLLDRESLIVLLSEKYTFAMQKGY